MAEANKKDLILDINDLVIHYETEDGVVEAVNGLDIQPVHSLYDSILGFIMDHQIIYIKNQIFFIRFCHCSYPPLFLQLRIQCIAQTVAQQIQGKDRDNDRNTRENRQMRCVTQICTSAGKHCAPLRSRRLNAQSQKA